MIKFLIPAIIFFLIVLFWEKISEKIYKKFQIKIDYVGIIALLLIFGLITILLYF